VSDGKGCHKSWLQQLEPGSSEEEKRLSCSNNITGIAKSSTWNTRPLAPEDRMVNISCYVWGQHPQHQALPLHQAVQQQQQLYLLVQFIVFSQFQLIVQSL
jgi:hypothetical protein